MARPIGSVEKRFWRYVSFDASGCWLWTGYVGVTDGYGKPKIANGLNGGIPRQAHIVSWEIHRGLVPEGLELDHLCRVRNCVNPNHLEPVTCGENGRRGMGFAAKNARKTHCDNGHEFTEENIYRWQGRRYCKTCRRERVRQQYKKDPRHSYERYKKYRSKKKAELLDASHASP